MIKSITRSLLATLFVLLFAVSALAEQCRVFYYHTDDFQKLSGVPVELPKIRLSKVGESDGWVVVSEERNPTALYVTSSQKWEALCEENRAAEARFAESQKVQARKEAAIKKILQAAGIADQ